METEHALHHMNQPMREALLPHASERRFEKGKAVFCHGDEAQFLWVLKEGWVTLLRHTPDGKESIIGLCMEGDLFGEAALFAHANYPHDAEIISDHATLLCIPSSELRALLQKDAKLSASILSLLNERVSKTQLKLEQMNTLSAAQRLGCFLLNLCHTQAHGSKTIRIPVEKHILASYLGMKPETFSRSQQQLRSLGIVVSGSDVTIENIAALRHFVCSSCSEFGSCESEEAV